MHYLSWRTGLGDDCGCCPRKPGLERSDAVDEHRQTIRADSRRTDANAMQLLSSPRLCDPRDGTDQRAKKLFKARKCIVCHTLEGRRGATAAEITYFGDKDPELIDFSHVIGARTLFNWNYQHLTEPDKVSPHTTMPTYNFQPEEARDLTLLLLSWSARYFHPNTSRCR